jgi:hypothetical protein
MVCFLSSDGDTRAAVYLHNAGHDVEAELKRFFEEVAHAVTRTGFLGMAYTRFHDPVYLAARYVAWKTEGDILADGVGVILPHQVHVNREFNVFCHAEPTMTPPTVTEAWR